MSHRRLRIGLAMIAFGLIHAPHTQADVDYLKDIKPLLKTHCVRCHGPLKAESQLRLDTKPLMIKGGDSGPAITPNNPATSILLKRIASESETRMPPEGDRLSEEAVNTFRQWIAAGAVSPAGETPDDPRSHWSYRPIARSALPQASDEWSGNPIDTFIARKHVAAKLSPRPIAARHVLLRRVYLDLIGLPPTRDQLRAFLADDSPDAYAKVVDSLLASPHYGEHWGRHWLDVWRYSDWYGFQGQVRFSQKNIWHWRDWVVESLNADKGYDRMVAEMLAGDEITPFDPANLRATGFLVRNRNTDSREQWIRDTVEHSAKAFLGITMGCVQCHDHPYDPISHDEYYRYRNIFEPVQVAIDSGGGGPDGVDVAGVARIFDRDRNAKTKFYIRGNDKTPDEKRTITPGAPQVIEAKWTEPQAVSLPAVARIPHLREPVHQQTVARLEHNVVKSKQVLAAAEKYLLETRARLRSKMQDDSKAGDSTFLVDAFQDLSKHWKTGRGTWDDSQQFVSQSTVDEPRDCYLETINNPPASFSLRLRLRITGGEAGMVGVMFNRSADGSRGEAVMLSTDPKQQGLRFFFEYGDERHFHDKHFRQLPINVGEEFVLRIDVLNGIVNIYVNDLLQQAYKVNSDPGSMRLLTINAAAEFHHIRIDELPDDAAIVPPETIPLLMPVPSLDKSHASHLELARAVIQQSKIQLEIDAAEIDSYRHVHAADVWSLATAPTSDDAIALASHAAKHEMLGIAAHIAQRKLKLANSKLTQFKATYELKVAESKLADGNSNKVAKEDAKKLTKAVESAKKKLEDATKRVDSTTMALSEPPKPHYQGLSGVYGSSSGRRLSLARWVTDPRNPLTARVAVNHIWLRHFGKPFVRTVFDFGLNGAKPSHPELLDWLAAELIQPSMVLKTSGPNSSWVRGQPEFEPWSMKHLHRLIVMSRVYRSASTTDFNNIKVDPDNELLWRMPARRMQAETVRDSVLAAANALDRKFGGPALPTGDGMHVRRRSLYFHQSPEDQMAFLKLFDGADSTECYQRNVSIVPHQALALFNSQLAIVQSRRLARELSASINDQTEFTQAAFEQVLSRPASSQDLRISLAFLESREAAYRAKSQQSDQLVEPTDYSVSAADPGLHARENLIHALFNHHEFVTIK